jgi:hypothetical protein
MEMVVLNRTQLLAIVPDPAAALCQGYGGKTRGSGPVLPFKFVTPKLGGVPLNNAPLLVWALAPIRPADRRADLERRGCRMARAPDAPTSMISEAG